MMPKINRIINFSAGRNVSFAPQWLIIEVKENELFVFAGGCRFLQQLRDRKLPEVFQHSVKILPKLIHRVNQSMLLDALAQSHQCNPLLVPTKEEKEKRNKIYSGGGVERVIKTLKWFFSFKNWLS